MHQSFILCAVTVFASMAAADDRQTTRLHPAGGGPSMSLTPLFGLFGVSAGVSLPVGDFGNGEDAQNVKDGRYGFAGVGFGIGVRGGMRFGSSPLGWVFDGSLVMQSLNGKDFEDAVRQTYGGLSGTDVDVEATNWWVIVPLLTGPRVGIDFGSVEVFAAGLLGGSVIRPPDVKVTATASGTTWGSASYDYELTGAFSVGAEAGVVIGGFTLSARFLFAGEPQSGTDARVEFVGFPVQNDSYTKDFALPMFQFSVGYTY